MAPPPPATAAFSSARKPGGCLAGIENFGARFADGFDELPGERGDAAETLQKIQRDPFRRQDRTGRAAHFEDRLAASQSGPVGLQDLDVKF